jgi:cytochrome c-type biogenesis protein CcmH/NrfF
MSRLAVGCVFVAALVVPAAAAPEDVATRVSQRIMSPFCDGVTLHDCPSQPADELRRDIADMARSGLTESEIIARLEAKFGDRILATPSSPLAWLLPAIVVVAGTGLVILLARRWAGLRPPPSPELDPAGRARVEAELNAFRGRR